MLAELILDVMDGDMTATEISHALGPDCGAVASVNTVCAMLRKLRRRGHVTLVGTKMVEGYHKPVNVWRKVRCRWLTMCMMHWKAR